jgi:predicted Rossmann fold flavoprotein
MCAMEAGKRGRTVLVLEHAGRTCGKVRISGGGQCNFTNRSVGREHYLSNNPHFCTSALSRFTPHDFISMVERQGIGFEERDGGRLFCSGSAVQIVEMLEEECRRLPVEFLLNCKIEDVSKGDTGFSVATGCGIFGSESLVIATGGLSMPGMGATHFGYAIAKQFGIKVTPLRPALTPLRLSPEDAGAFGTLAGISIDCAVSSGKVKFRDSILFTHKGLSGPAILQISSHWDGTGEISIDLLPDVDIHSILLEHHSSRMLLSTLLDRYLPGRFVKTWCDRCFASKPLNQYSSKELDSLALLLQDWRIRPAGVEGFNKAEVTLGGVDTVELSSKTMESRKVSGLYFTGEVVDVTGQLGGYNLHWAWASGHAAGQCV